MIVAATPKGEIGYKNTIPWRLNGDLSRFKRLTMGQVVVMGLRTYESLPVALEGRQVIVLSRFAAGTSKALTLAAARDETILVCTSLQDAINTAARCQGERVLVAGGAALYQEVLHEFKPVVHLTTVYKPPSSPYYDTKIDNFDFRNFVVVDTPQATYEVNEKTGVMELSHTYVRYYHKDVHGLTSHLEFEVPSQYPKRT